MTPQATLHLEAKSRYSADLASLIRAEYREMPGLSLTLTQAAKLWNVDRDSCLTVLETLVREGFLSRLQTRYRLASELGH